MTFLRHWAVVLGVYLASVLSSPAATAGQISPERLRCEYLENPIGLDSERPRLSWIVTGDGRGRRQTAYQIIAGESEEALEAGKNVLWDSGKVASSETNPIRYGGPVRGPTDRTSWKVRVWDEFDVMSDWSPTAFWEAGLPSAAEWHGKWIARSAFDRNSTAASLGPIMRRSFVLDGAVKRARAYIVGLGFFELSINGQRVGDHLLDPAFTRYDRRMLYVTHDVTSALRRGENVLGVMLGNGWFNVETKAPWDFDQAPWRATPRMLLELRVEYEDGRTLVVTSDESWKTADGPITFSGIYGGESYDARLEESGWDWPGFDDHAWAPALVVDSPKGRIVGQSMHPVRLDQMIRPVNVTRPAPGVVVFDAGQNLTGNAELNVRASAGTVLTLRYSEKLGPDGRIDPSNIDVYIKRGGETQQFQTDQYTCKGDGIERWHSRFTYHGFRYVEVTGASEEFGAENLAIRWFHSDVAKAGEFECSNPLLNRIWQNGRWSYLGNLFGYPTDCPHREKNGWTADAHVACEQGLFYADGVTIYEKWMNDMADEQFVTGALPGIVPTSGQWGYAFGSGPAWDSAFLIVPWHIYEYYGDDTLLREHYEGHKRYVDYLASRSHEGIVEMGLGDWSTWKTETPVALTDTGYFYRNARQIATVAHWLKKDSDAAAYGALAESIRTAFNRKFYDDTTATYGAGSQTALGAALYHRLVEPTNEARVIDSLAQAVVRNNGHLDFGLLGSKYVLNVLSNGGRADVAYMIASQRTQPSWGWWLEQGATTLWERWTTAESQNHTYLGDINAWMIKSLAGIQPDPAGPGFKRIIIAPNPVGDLTSAKARYDSVRGPIACEWVKENEEFRLTLSIPPNCVATVFLPRTGRSIVTESGTSIEAVHGVKALATSGEHIPLEVGSGTYYFVVH